MSFDEISEFRKCLSDISKNDPGLINAGQRNLLWVIISYPDGCFIGFEELALQVGLSTDTINGYLRALTKLGFIDREQSYARKGVRQCYRVRVNVMRSRSLLPVTPIELSRVLPELLPPVTSDVKPVTSGVIASDQSHTYKYNKYNRNDKELDTRLVINVERWNVVSAKLDPHVKRKFQPNKESEHLLDVILELPGITATGLRDRLGAINFATSTNNTGLLMNYLRELSGAKEANRSHHRTEWCGKCEKVSRTYAEQGPGNDGKLTNDCPTCNDNQVRVKEREVINDPELLKQFGWNSFGSIPD
jgi:DNA-binding Lrp family transcriptional regulator